MLSEKSGMEHDKGNFMHLNEGVEALELGVDEDDAKTFLREVSESEAKQYPQYDGVNDAVDIEDAE